MERWTIVTEDGLVLWREDLFTESEAREHVAANPFTPNGTPQVAVPETVARELGKERRRIGDEHERAKQDARKKRTAEIVARETERRAYLALGGGNAHTLGIAAAETEAPGAWTRVLRPSDVGACDVGAPCDVSPADAPRERRPIAPDALTLIDGRPASTAPDNETRTEAYARGLVDARRIGLPHGMTDAAGMAIVRGQYAARSTDARRAYWLGVARGLRNEHALRAARAVGAFFRNGMLAAARDAVARYGYSVTYGETSDGADGAALYGIARGGASVDGGFATSGDALTAALFRAEAEAIGERLYGYVDAETVHELRRLRVALAPWTETETDTAPLVIAREHEPAVIAALGLACDSYARPDAEGGPLAALHAINPAAAEAMRARLARG